MEKKKSTSFQHSQFEGLLLAIHSTLVFVEITSCIYTYTKTIVIFNFGEIVASRPGKYSATISKNNG